MTKEDRLNFCSICTHQTFDGRQGIICGLSNKDADFNSFCTNFIEDTSKTVREYREKPTINYVRAGRLKRLINDTIDSVVVVISYLFVSGLVQNIETVFFPSSVYMLVEEESLLSSIFGFASILFYFCFFEYRTGQTIGKLITKTKVVAVNGEEPSLLSIIIRTACRYIPFEEVTFLFSNRSGLHDYLSNTKVVLI